MCFRICPRHPRKRRLSVLFGTLSDDWQLTSTIGCLPPRGSHRAARRRKSHHSAADLRLGRSYLSFTAGFCSLHWEIFASAAVGLLAAEIVPGRVAIHFSRSFFYFYPNYTPELCLCRELNLLVSSTFSPVFKKLSLYSWTIASS